MPQYNFPLLLLVSELFPHALTLLFMFLCLVLCMYSVMMKLFILFGKVINPHPSCLMQTFKAQLLVVKYINLKQSKFHNFVLFFIFYFVHCLVCVACVCLFNFLSDYFFLWFLGLCGWFFLFLYFFLNLLCIFTCLYVLYFFCLH